MSKPSSKTFEFDHEDTPEPFIGFDAVMKLINNTGACFSFEEKELGSSIYTYVSGLVKDVDQTIDDLLTRFNPLGYGTYVKFQTTFSRYKVALVYRSKSCD
jgi:hypothetical protein